MSARITIAMIVRDESEMVPGFLESVRGLWDELVVVDTGSTDDTIELFLAAGARVVKHEWHDDFAEARNVALEHVTGDWVLVLDADERVSPEFILEFLSTIEDASLGALTVRMCNSLPYGHRRESRLLRAWRHDAAIHFRYAIHEDASSDVARMLHRERRTIFQLEAPIEHLGYVRERAAAKQKKSRDFALLHRCLEQDPNDFYARLKLLELARFWRDGVLWREEATAAISALEHAPRGVIAKRPWSGELVALIAEALFSTDSPMGLAFLDSWEDAISTSAAFFHRRAQCHEALGNIAAAETDFHRCLAQRDLVGDQQLSTTRPLLGLARIALMRGDRDEAAARCTAALELSPRDPEALLATAALNHHLFGLDGLECWATAHRERHGAHPELDWAVGEAHYSAGQFGPAIVALRRAAGVPPGGLAAVRLAQALLAAGNREASEQLARVLLPSEPEAGLGLLVFDLIDGRDSALELELTPESAQAAMRHWVDALVLSGNRGWFECFARNAGSIIELFPWLESRLRRAATG